MTSKFIVAASADDVKEGEVLAINIDETPIGLTRINGKIFAFGDVCTHDGGPLAEGEIDAGCIVCPRHGARFDLTTGKPTFPAVSAIPIYETLQENDQVKIKL